MEKRLVELFMELTDENLEMFERALQVSTTPSEVLSLLQEAGLDLPDSLLEHHQQEQ